MATWQLLGVRDSLGMIHFSFIRRVQALPWRALPGQGKVRSRGSRLRGAGLKPRGPFAPTAEQQQVIVRRTPKSPTLSAHCQLIKRLTCCHHTCSLRRHVATPWTRWGADTWRSSIHQDLATPASVHNLSGRAPGPRCKGTCRHTPQLRLQPASAFPVVIGSGCYL